MPRLLAARLDSAAVRQAIHTRFSAAVATGSHVMNLPPSQRRRQVTSPWSELCAGLWVVSRAGLAQAEAGATPAA